MAVQWLSSVRLLLLWLLLVACDSDCFQLVASGLLWLLVIVFSCENFTWQHGKTRNNFPLTFTASTVWPKEKIVQDCVLLCPDGVADALPGFAGFQKDFFGAVFCGFRHLRGKKMCRTLNAH